MFGWLYGLVFGSAPAPLRITAPALLGLHQTHGVEKAELESVRTNLRKVDVLAPRPSKFPKHSAVARELESLAIRYVEIQTGNNRGKRGGRRGHRKLSASL